MLSHKSSYIQTQTENKKVYIYHFASEIQRHVLILIHFSCCNFYCRVSCSFLIIRLLPGSITLRSVPFRLLPSRQPLRAPHLIVIRPNNEMYMRKEIVYTP